MIAGRHVGIGRPCFIIAEAGVNHNGDYESAKKLIELAADAGADAVKFQTFKSDGVASCDTPAPAYPGLNQGDNRSQAEILEGLALPYSYFRGLKEHCDKNGVIFLSTPHSFDAIDFLADLVPAYKFGSGDLTNIPALEHAAKKKKPMILGAGMATMQEVQQAIAAVKKEGNDEIVALHCTSEYPCPPKDVNLRAMRTMMERTGCLVGYSDHTLEPSVPALAAAMGAVILEKHFTLDRDLPGPDHKASLGPEGLRHMVAELRSVETMLGRAEKRPTEAELSEMGLLRKSLVADTDIKRGEKIERSQIAIKRPGCGIKPGYLKRIIGSYAKGDILEGKVLEWGDIEGGEGEQDG